jgi:hypothetical protein
MFSDTEKIFSTAENIFWRIKKMSFLVENIFRAPQ